MLLFTWDFLNSRISVVFLVSFYSLVGYELSEPLGFLVSSPYKLSYEEKADNYVQLIIITIISVFENIYTI